jgi:iron(III) transport system ATP-binding protein
MALLGPSGCGKTTLLRLIAGFEIPDAGTVSLGSKMLAGGRWVPPERRRVGLVFQDYALFPHLNVGSNIAFGLPSGQDRKRRVRELLDLVGLHGLERRMPNELSGGQQQRVALARTLAAEPQLVLLDEPFSNLDPSLRQRVRSEVRQIIETLHMTAIYVTHDQEEALSLAAQVAVMLDGRIEQVGSPSDVYRRPVSRPVAEFLGDANFFAGEVRDGRLECELGAVAVATAVQGAVDVMVRPEHLTLSAEGGRPVEIVATEYFGHDQMVTAQTHSGALVKVRLLPGMDLETGQRMGLCLSGEPVVYERLSN